MIVAAIARGYARRAPPVGGSDSRWRSASCTPTRPSLLPERSGTGRAVLVVTEPRGCAARHRARPDALHQQLRERPRAAADVERPVTVLQLGHLDELLSERACVPAHEPVVRVPTHLERGHDHPVARGRARREVWPMQ